MPYNDKSSGSPSTGINTSALLQKIHSNPMKANHLIKNYRYCLPTYENKVFTYMLTLLSDSSDNVVYLDIDEYHAMAGLSPASGGKAWSDFFTACCNLQDNHLFVIDDNPDSKYLANRITLVERVSPLRRSNKVEIALTGTGKDLLVNVSKMLTQNESGHMTLGYTRLYVPGIMKMKGTYSGRLYEILKYEALKGEQKGSLRIKVDTLRKLMSPYLEPGKEGKRTTNLVEGYKEFKDLRKAVLLPAIYEINEFSDIRIDIEDEPIRDENGKIKKHVLNKEKEHENFRQIKYNGKTMELLFVVEMKSEEEMRVMQRTADNDIANYKANYDRTITAEQKQEILRQIIESEYEPDESKRPIVINPTLQYSDTEKRYNLAKAFKRILTDDFISKKRLKYGMSDERTNHKGQKINDGYRFDQFFDIFVDAVWEDIRDVEDKEDSLILNNINNLLKEMRFKDFISCAMHEYGTDSFWEGRGEVKFRKKYLKKSLQNLLKEYEACDRLIKETSRYLKDDILANHRYRVPKFRVNSFDDDED